jgi:hypothetical protein
VSSKNQLPKPNANPATWIRHDSVVRPTTLRNLASVSSKGKLVRPTPPLISWIQDASPLGVKQEPQDVQASVAGPSKALWDEWSRYQSKQKMLDDSGMHLMSPLCIRCLPHQSPVTSLSYGSESRALCSSTYGTNSYCSIIRNH